MITADGFLKLDSRGRISVGRYTELGPGQFFRITANPDETLTLTPIIGKEGTDG